MLKTYFLTVTTTDVAHNLDPNAVLVKVLPEAQVEHTYCCQPPQTVGFLPQRFVFQVMTNKSRREVENTAGVVRVRTKKLEHYRGESGFISKQMC